MPAGPTIIYACDGNYAPLTAISAVSALRHNGGARIALLGYNLDDEARDLVRTRVEAAGGEFVYYDVSGAISGLKARGYNGYTSYAAYARVFAPELLREDGRALYLDCDTFVNGPLGELMEIDMRGRPIALGGDCIPAAYKRHIRHPAELAYYNTGVMLIDLKRWRERRCTERVLGELENPRGPNPLGDQDVIVRCFPDETLPLGPKWNFISHYFLVSYRGWRRITGGPATCSRAEYDEARRGAAIYHFSGNTLGRPWYTCSRNPMRFAYRAVAKAAGLAEFAEQARPMPFDYRVQWILYRMLPQALFDVVSAWMYRVNVWRLYHV